MKPPPANSSSRSIRQATDLRPAPALPSHGLRNFLIVFLMILGGFVAYAYTKNPEGCRKVVADSNDVVQSLLPGGKVSDSTAPAVVTGASIGGDVSPAQVGSPAMPPTAVATTPSPTPPPVAPATPAPTTPAPVYDIPAQPNWNWTTLDGKTYQNVVINKIDADMVTITHSSGISHLPMNMLPDDVKKALHYDPAAAAAAAAAVSHLVDGKLVAADGIPFATPGADVQYYAVYYSAAWCPPCHLFTPKLVAWYNKFKPAHPNFEVIFVSSDNSEAEMLGYMKSMSMPWPGVRFSELTHSGTGIEKYANSGIPDLVLIDASGNVLSDSFHGATYVGPGVVVDDINRIVGGKTPVPLVDGFRRALPATPNAVAISDVPLRQP